MTDRICTIDGCPKAAISRGWCTLHYQRWQRHGDPTVYIGPVGRPQAPLVHGSRRMYDLGCRCLPCAVEESRYKADWARGRKRRLPADQVRAHLEQLLASGWTRVQITAEAGIGSSTLWHVEHRARWVNSRTADAILAVEPLRRDIVLDAGPLIAAIRAKRVPIVQLLERDDCRAFYRAASTGRIGEAVADRLAVRALGRTIDEIYGPGWDQQEAVS